MKITHKPTIPQSIMYGSIGAGECFRVEGVVGLFLKTTANNGKTSICIASGHDYTFKDSDDGCHIVNAEVVRHG